VNRLFRRRDEQGMALITVIMLSMIATLFVTTTMYVAFHDQTSSAHNRSWGQALHVAESGVHQAVAYLQSSSGVVPSTTQTGTTAEGTYQYRIVAQARNRYQIDAVGTVGSSGSLQASRRLRVTMAPPLSFKYALFSNSDVTTKNNNNVCGDVYATTYVQVYNGDAVRASTSSTCPSGGTIGSGNVTAATGYIAMDNNSVVEGTAWSGGYDSSGNGISNSGSIGGDAKASSSTPDCNDDGINGSDHLLYKITGGTVAGNATAQGAITSTVAGTKTQNTCTQASESQLIPTFQFNTANYPAATLHTYTFPADYATFNSYIAANKNSLSGTFYIQGGGSSYPVDLGGVTVTGDLTVYAAALNGNGAASPIDASGGIGASGTGDKLVVLASEYSAPASGCATNGGNPGDCAIGIKNNFSPSSSTLSGGDNTAVLLYAPNGPIAFKNNADFQGAVYANNIQVKNNMNITYDPRLESIVGFGYTTLQITDWRECDPGSVTTSSCG
jgi:Tfp pilus assembly protein PilX